MPVSLMNPDGHVVVPLYHHIAVATGSRHVYIAGQVAWDEHGNLVAPGDLAGQVLQVYRNIGKALDAAGATFHDVVRITWYAAGWKRDHYHVDLEDAEGSRVEPSPCLGAGQAQVEGYHGRCCR